MDKFEQHIKRMKRLREVYEVGTGQHNILSMLINECEAALRQPDVSGQLPLPSERFDAENWLGERKDIWNHPRVTDRNDKESYEVADLMAEFANWYYGNGNLR